MREMYTPSFRVLSAGKVFNAFPCKETAKGYKYKEQNFFDW